MSSELAEMTRPVSVVTDGWESRKLEEVCRLWNGRAYKKEELLENGKYLVLRVGNFFTNDRWYYSDLELEDEKYCDDGDLLYAWSASFGPRVWAGGKVIYHYNIWKIAVDDRLIDKDFLFHFLDWDAEQIKNSMGSGSTMIHVTKGAMEQRAICLPPLDEQQRIAEVLQSVDEAIAAVDAVMSGLESAASEIAKRAFTDPDNVELEHEIVTFGDLFDIKGGNQPPKSSFIYQPRDGYVRLLQIRDFESDDKAAYISEKSSNVRCGTDDILIARYGASVGRILTGKAGAYNVALTKIVFRDRKILQRYAYHWLKSDYFQDRISAVSNRSAQAGFNKEDLFPTKIALPPLAKQAEIAEALDDIEKAMRASQRERQQMKEVKGSLLDDLLSGQVRVPA